MNGNPTAFKYAIALALSLLLLAWSRDSEAHNMGNAIPWNRYVMPAVPKFQKPATFKLPKNAIEVSGPFSLKSALKLDGLFPATVPSRSSIKIVAVLPDGYIFQLLTDNN